MNVDNMNIDIDVNINIYFFFCTMHTKCILNKICFHEI